MKHKYFLVGALLLVAVLILAACQSAAPTTSATSAPAQPAATQAPCPTSAPAPECPAPATPVVQSVPFQDEWASSPHNDAKAMAFNDWNETDTKEVPTTCAKCHSTPGFQDFMGADGSEAGKVDKAAPIGTTIQCVACHNEATAVMTSVTFPSGAEIKVAGQKEVCMECHQGRASKVQVDAAIEKAGMKDNLDTVIPDQSFINIHYFAAAATLLGNQVQGGYQYDGKTYDGRNDHVAGFNTCVGCHDQHTLEIKVEDCKACHTNVNTKDDLKNIRMNGSLVDYNGNGDITEGISAELAGLQQMLMTGIQAYAKEKAGAQIAYTPDAYPYFFVDTNGDGQASADEAKSENAYKAWTGRLLKAAYNYQTSVKDPGAFAHGGKYIIELLYDSIDDLNTQITEKVDLSKAHRIDAGHFAGSQEAFRHWDSEPSGLVPAGCVKCHDGAGLPMFLANGATIAVPPTNGLMCSTCHDDLTKFTRYQTTSVTFPSGAKLAFADSPDANLCLNCHQGRESKSSVDNAIAASTLKDDQVASKEQALNFRNPHYFAAGADLFGTEAKGAYEYNGQKYNGKNLHVPAFDTCIECHDSHALTVQAEKCGACHAGVKTEADLATIRKPAGDTTDYDGDGNVTEGIAGEVAGMQAALYAGMQKYATDKTKVGIVYDPASYPYYFIDKNNDGKADADEINADNAYLAWTPRLLRAAYNYQWSIKDPGAFAHNGAYIMQVLYDSIKDVGGSVTGMTRPAVAATAPAQ